jgi:hypothetical protein
MPTREGHDRRPNREHQQSGEHCHHDNRLTPPPTRDDGLTPRMEVIDIVAERGRSAGARPIVGMSAPESTSQ